MAKFSEITVTRRGAHLGAEKSGVDFSKPQSNSKQNLLFDALMENEFLVFPEIDITVEEQAQFGKQFGELSVHPFSPHDADMPELIILDNDGERPPLATDIWHSDETFREVPPMCTILRARIVPEVGGDTVFASMTAAFEGLSERWQCFLTGLEAVHDFKPFRRLYSSDPASRDKLHAMEKQFPNPAHPVVRLHPVTGKKAIFVSPQFTSHIKGMTDAESQSKLDMLYRLTEIPEYQFRVGWKPGTMVFWDNRSTQHYAARDYLPHRRRMERVTLRGDAVVGAVDAMDGLVKAATRNNQNPKPASRRIWTTTGVHPRAFCGLLTAVRGC